MKSWAEIGFEIERTRDNSPTLRLIHSIDPERPYGESMHHSAGACGETLLIYATPARAVLQQVLKPSFLIVGLGLGYIEMSIAKEALLLGKNPQDIEKITSFESMPELREYFYHWLWNRHEFLHTEVRRIYDEALACVIQDSSVIAEDIQSFLRFHFDSIEKLSGELTETTDCQHRYHAIMYDAYSSKTTPFLWQEDFLIQFFTNTCSEASLVSTYSGKMEFREALRKTNFTVVSREAFYGKRKSTLGYRFLQL